MKVEGTTPMRVIHTLILSFLTLASLIPTYATTDENTLNPDFATHMGTVVVQDEWNDYRLIVYDEASEMQLSILRSEIMEASFEHLGAYLDVYNDSGHALYILPDGQYHMQLMASNTAINIMYASNTSQLRSASTISMEDDVLLQESTDGAYRLYLLTTGELQIALCSGSEAVNYTLTFTGLPALNMKQEVQDMDCQDSQSE